MLSKYWLTAQLCPSKVSYALVLKHSSQAIPSAVAQSEINHEHTGTHDRPGARRLRRRLRMAGRLRACSRRTATTSPIVQNPTTSLADDVAVTKRIVGRAERPGDSRRPFVRRRGDHRSRHRSQGRGPRLHRGLRAGQGRVGSSLIKNPPPGAPVPPILPPQDGFLFLDRGEVPRVVRRGCERRGRRLHGGLAGAVGRRRARRRRHRAGVEDEAELVPGRHRRQDDPADAQRAMSKRAGATVVEVKGSHAVYVSQPKAVADLIEKAATGVLK